MREARPGLFTWVAIVLFSSSPNVQAVWLDPTFGSRGIVITYAGGAGAAALALQPDGGILVAGSGSDGAVVLVRYDPQGNLDLVFGTGGIATLSVSPNGSSTTSMALQADGRIVVAGAEFGGRFFVARFLSDGSPDPAFGSGGFVTTDFPGLSANANALAIQQDGKIVVTGSIGVSFPIPNQDFAAARYNTDGSLDSSFGSGGRVVLDLGGRLPEFAKAVVVQANGRIVLGGMTEAGNGFVLAGLLPDGTPDVSFGVAGKVFLSYGVGADCNALVLQPDGKIIAAGAVFPPDAELVVRLFPDGSLDPSFGAGGIATVPAPANAQAIAIDSAGRIVLAGSADFVLTRLLSDGRPDPSIGPQGWLSAQLDGGAQHHANATSIAIQPDGKILLGGVRNDFINYVSVLRYSGAVPPVPTLSALGWLLFAGMLAAAGWATLSRGA